MIELKRGDILKADVEAIVNTVNCMGAMGRGIALQFKKTFPDNFKYYEAACKQGLVQPGVMCIYDTGNLVHPRYIINFPTKRHWKGKSQMEDIESGLVALVAEVKNKGIKSIAIPPLGCGLGGLAWSEVLPRIEAAFAQLSSDISVLVYEPAGAPSAENIAKTTKKPTMTIGRAALLALTRRYLDAVMDPTFTLLELQKLMYFMQESGENLNLHYQKAPYGPYAKTLSHVLNHIEGHFIYGYLDGGDAPEKPLELNLECIPIAEAFLEEHSETHARFDRVTDLIQGFETPYGMELLSTVHWVAKHEHATTLENIISKVHNWNPRKKMFRVEQINIALSTLTEKGWLN